MPFWTLPLIVTVIAFWRAFSFKDDTGGMFAGVGVAMALVAALIVSLITWLIYFIAV